MITTRPHCPPCECAECAAAAQGWAVPLGLGMTCAHLSIVKDCPECVAADLVLRSAKEYETKFLADVTGPSPLDRKINRAIAGEIEAWLPADAGQKIMAAVAQDAEEARGRIRYAATELVAAADRALVAAADRAAEAEHTTERRRVALTDLPNGDHVSTVLLHAHLADGGDPDAYETLVTRGPHEGMCERHATRREAERAHRVMVDMLSADE